MSKVIFAKNAQDISIKQVGRGKGTIELTVNDVSTTLNRRHPISIISSLTTEENAVDEIMGGHFLFKELKDGSYKLAEYRDASYNGFMHDEDTIQLYGSTDDLISRTTSGFNIEELGIGGGFNITAGFDWSVFSKNITTQLSLERLVCSNGAKIRNKMFEREVPIINMHEKHLNIAAQQMIHIGEQKFKKRFKEMAREHASVREVHLIQSHVARRLSHDQNNSTLIRMNQLLTQYGDITQYYTASAIESGLVSALNSPISRFDLYNIATEMNTHTEAHVESTDVAVDRIVSNMLFPRELEGCVTDMSRAKSTFGSPEQAFFGH
jgi:hypothetical protein